MTSEHTNNERLSFEETCHTLFIAARNESNIIVCGRCRLNNTNSNIMLLVPERYVVKCPICGAKFERMRF